MAHSLRLLMIVLPVFAALAGTPAEARAGQPKAQQTFSIHVPGKVEVAVIGRKADGTLATIRVTASEEVEVMVERRPAATSPVVPVLRTRLTAPHDSLTVPAADLSFDSAENARSVVILTVVPL